MRHRQRKRGIYLLPTLFTVANLFCGFSSVIQASRGRLELAAVLVVAAAILDALDGRIARLTGTTSAFGVEFDSLADIVSFGIAPAFLAYAWSLHEIGRWGWMAAFLFVVCAAMRLARFNIGSPSADKRHFAGLPSPMAGCVVAAAAFAVPQVPQTVWVARGVAVAIVAVALLMVSRMRYRSFKELNLRDRRSYIYVLPVAAAVVAFAAAPTTALLALTSVYVLSGPALYLWGLVARQRAAEPRGPAQREVVDEPVLR